MTTETLSSYRTLATMLRHSTDVVRIEIADALDALAAEVERLTSRTCGTCIYHGDCSVQNRLTLQRRDGATGAEDFCSIHTPREHVSHQTAPVSDR